ncbi:carbon monoxide dehydrogenase accessory protein [Streptomyces sp. HNM0575]|uniref:XdhC family protein n=1 Tax=Streptomyces sp. HNM0575 TaxID=2716338 RepID=UPI00145DD485|nr:XdhC family protein [Streptomyces sp. HNM0575]NLU74007.1 carbon monoxide dehydrogenase accessory protein [Streptomyces sp. HNM0575]
MPSRVSTRAGELAEHRVPFAHARVVRAQVPTSAHAGDEAIVLQDGSVDGFVGGVCAEGTVRTAALRAMREDAAVLLRVLPAGDDASFPDSPGAEVVVNPCLSGGALEIFIEPRLPPPLLGVVGRTPVADALVAMAEVLGHAVVRSGPGTGGAGADGADGDREDPDRPDGAEVSATEVPKNASAVIVATHGRDEEGTIRAALDAGVRYVALVASPRRGRAVLEGMGLTPEEAQRVSTPAGFDIGARTAPEVALSILAEMVGVLRADEREAHGTSGAPYPADVRPEAPRQESDLVCGMTVTVMPDTPRLTVDGAEVFFCGTGCRDGYARGTGGSADTAGAEADAHPVAGR